MATPIDAAWMRECAGSILAQRHAEADRVAEQAHAEAAARRAAKIAEGFDPDDSLIEKIRAGLDLDTVLRAHSYAVAGGQGGTKYRHPNSESGSYGADIKVLGGVERVFSHNGTDPLHASNLPAWCGGVTAIDAFDVVVILDYGGDRREGALRTRQEIRPGEDRRAQGHRETAVPHGQAASHPRGNRSGGIRGRRASRLVPRRGLSRCDVGRQGGPIMADGFPNMGAGARTNGHEPDAWPEPVDFLTDREHGAPQLKERHVPPSLWPFIADTAERLGVATSSVALAAIVACASVISEEWQIQPKRHDFTWTEAARLWGAIVGPPSILKTPVIAVTTAPIVAIEVAARKEWAEQMALHRAALAAWKAGDKTDAEPTPPRKARYLVESATIEALQEVLRDDDDGKLFAPQGKVLVRQDELSEFLAGMDKYSTPKEATAAHTSEPTTAGDSRSTE